MNKTTTTLYAFLLLLAVAFIQASCKSKQQSTDPQLQEALSHKAFQLEVKPVILDTTRYGNDTFAANKVRVNGDTLFIEVEYSGGCKDHVFTARHNGNYMKSMPPQLNVNIDHNANGDGCRELIRETIAFDLSGCRVGKTGTLILLINADRSKKATYTY